MDATHPPEAGHRPWPQSPPWPQGPPWSPGPPWGRRHRHGAGLAVVAALVQVVGTTLAARGQAEVRDLDLLGYALLAGGALALAARHRAPVVTLAAAAGTAVAYAALDYPGGPTFVAMVIAVVVAVKAGRRYPAWAVTGGAYLAWLVLAQPGLEPAVVLGAGTVGLLLFAEAARVGARQRAQLGQMHAEQARARAEQQRRRASEERLRIAQELHDVLGHHLSLINVQAGVGLHLMGNQPEQARAALGTIRRASAEALREVRSVLSTLYPDGQAAPRTPAPRLGRLDELTRDAGLPVVTAVEGAARPVPAELDRAAYRIVQEALTNVRRHAGPAATATVVIEYRDQEVVVRVDDDGGAAGPAGVPSEGNGIGGMRERAAALGGSLRAGPRPGGGFAVRARLPVPGGSGVPGRPDGPGEPRGPGGPGERP